MSVTVETGTTLPFDRFWTWLRRHANCIVRAGTVDAYLHDQEAFHWNLEEDQERNPVVQLVWGKLLVAELVLDLRDVLYVEATPDEEGEPGQYVFDVVAGTRDGPHAAYHFVLAHGIEDEGKHAAGGLKH
jgi:hypothetical protein